MKSKDYNKVRYNRTRVGPGRKVGQRKRFKKKVGAHKEMEGI